MHVKWQTCVHNLETHEITAQYLAKLAQLTWLRPHKLKKKEKKKKESIPQETFTIIYWKT